MNQSTKRILFSTMTVIFLLTSCAPAPVATQDPALVRQVVDQALTAAAQNVQAKDKQLIEESVASTVAAQNAQATEGQAQIDAQVTIIPTASPFVLTPQVTESIQTTTTPFDPNAPTVEAISPNSGFTTGGTTVTITGTNFMVGRDLTQFYFGTKEATNVNCKSTTECTAITPFSVGGNVTVKAVLAGNGSQGNDNSDTFTFIVLDPNAPLIDVIAPSEGPTQGGVVVTITGQNFIQGRGTGATQFYFGDKPGTDVICETPIKCTVKIPPGQEGIVLVRADNGGIQSQHTPGNERDGFKYNGTPDYGCGVTTLAPDPDPKTFSNFSRGEGFVIKWIFMNTGKFAWPAGLDVKYSGGVKMSTVTSVEIPKIIKPNETYAIKINAVAPSDPGTYYMTWSVEGMGCNAYVAIFVE